MKGHTLLPSLIFGYIGCNICVVLVVGLNCKSEERI